jgi:hypothetical protein
LEKIISSLYSFLSPLLISSPIEQNILLSTQFQKSPKCILV